MVNRKTFKRILILLSKTVFDVKLHSLAWVVTILLGVGFINYEVVRYVKIEKNSLEL